MYRHQTRIPTLVALFILLFGIGGGILLVETSHPFSSSADISSIPKNIHISNISDSQFSISFTTDKSTTGYVRYTDNNSTNLTAFDDRDVDGKAKNYSTHYVSLTNLKENTNYFFKIISGNASFDNNGEFYHQITGPKIATALSIDPAYGVILQPNDKPALGAIVYLTIGKSLPLSTLVKSDGTWLIPLNTSRTQDLLNRPQIGSPEIIQISVVFDQNLSASAITDTKNDTPLPTMNLGKSYDFRNLQGVKKTAIARSIVKDQVLGATVAAATQNSIPSPTYSKIDILFPGNLGTTSDTKPLIKGVGIPGKGVVITVNSTPMVSEVTVSLDGTWSFIPSQALAPGEHSVSITTSDANGKTVTLTKKFIVLKSGESVLGESTPSGTQTPFLSPTVFPTISPIITFGPTTSTPPVTGNSTPTYVFLGLGIIFVLLGLKFIFIP